MLLNAVLNFYLDRSNGSIFFICVVLDPS